MLSPQGQSTLESVYLKSLPLRIKLITLEFLLLCLLDDSVSIRPQQERTGNALVMAFNMAKMIAKYLPEYGLDVSSLSDDAGDERFAIVIEKWNMQARQMQH